jgi:prepilin-type N-terminal cleavage/methylation domain-containing protein
MNPIASIPTSRRGFTLTEMILALVLTSAMAATALSVIMTHSRSVTRMEATVRQLEQVRLSADLLATEIGDVTRSGVLFARGDSLAFRLPVAWGVVCGQITRNIQSTGKVKKAKKGVVVVTPYDSNAALFFEQPATALGAPAPEGWGVSANGRDWTFYDVANWNALGIVTDTVTARPACLDVVPVNTKKLKKGATPPPPPPATPGLATDYWRFPMMGAVTGAPPPERGVFAAFIKISYFLKPDSSGSLALYRRIGGVTQKLAWPFANNAGFQYALSDGTIEASVAAGDLTRVRKIKTTLPARKEANARWQADSILIAPWMPLYNAR